MCRVLESRGWVLDRIKGSHHIDRLAGHSPISVPVHGNKNLKPGTQRSIMRAAGLTDDDV
ncbi:MAG TPA: type II toxin-antitoxin system HicA family toxin [Gemmataceae bacterium]|nr:type II toxin-antitoxin system HicA family toxin [Gemmataceae bacterium]